MNGFQNPSNITNLDSQLLNVRTLLLIISICISGLAFSHDYFFAYAEVEYNDVSQRVEGTITVTTHDLERALEINGILSEELDPKRLNSDEIKKVENFLFEHFNIKFSSSCILRIVGFESLLNGISNFYFESDPILFEGNAEFNFDLLMGEFPGQQNKISFIYRNTTKTLTFLPTETNKNIIFLDEE